MRRMLAFAKYKRSSSHIEGVAVVFDEGYHMSWSVTPDLSGHPQLVTSSFQLLCETRRDCEL